MDFCLDLPGDASAPAVARQVVRESIPDGPLRVDALIVVSELVANAWRHGEPPLRLALAVDEDDPSCIRLRISVTNSLPVGSSSVPEAILGGRPDGHGGRGIELVAHLADEWGWSQEGRSITVWVLLGSQDPLGLQERALNRWAATA